MGVGTVGLDPTIEMARVRAACREVGGTTFVAPVGFASDIFDLSGSAAVVWNALVEPATIAVLARRCGVEPTDELLDGALTALIDQGLVHVDAQP